MDGGGDVAITKEALYQKSPQEITMLLYEACYDNLEKAIEYIDEKNYIDANIHLQSERYRPSLRGRLKLRSWHYRRPARAALQLYGRPHYRSEL